MPVGATHRMGGAPWALVAWLAGACLAAPASAGPNAEAADCTVYAYIDSSGRLVKTVARSAVPPQYESSLMTFSDCEQARALAAQGGRQAEAAPSVAPSDRPAARARVERGASVASWLGWFTGLSPWKGILLIFCWATGLAGGIGILVTAFRVSLWWGLGCLLLPFAALVFVILHWRISWPSFVANLFGAAAAGLLFVWNAPLPF